jgi:predicted transcriptional regulator
MSSSFRFSPQEEFQLKHLARKLGKTKTAVIKLALNKLSQAQSENEAGSVWESLLATGFKPLPFDIGDLAHDEKAQRDLIRRRIDKKHRN